MQPRRDQHLYVGDVVPLTNQTKDSWRFGEVCSDKDGDGPIVGV